MDNTNNFSQRAADYTIGRPVYAQEFIDYLYSKEGLSEKSVIADIGSGTGKFASQLLARGSKVFCVEPNEDMRNTAAKELGEMPNAIIVNGSASEITLASASVDFVTTAQAFHWFDVAQFQSECKRILKPDGIVALIWNMRDMKADINKRAYEIYKEFCPNFKGFGGGIKRDDERIKQFFNGSYKRVVFDNPLSFDEEKWIKRSLSGSYSIKEGDVRYEKYIGVLKRLFLEYSDNGIMQMPNYTVAYIGKA